jgi:hypothetical protein
MQDYSIDNKPFVGQFLIRSELTVPPFQLPLGSLTLESISGAQKVAAGYRSVSFIHPVLLFSD